MRIPQTGKFIKSATPRSGRSADAFPSCAGDIQKARSCYALGQEDGCVHHLMLVLERGLKALAAKLGVQYQPQLAEYHQQNRNRA